MVACLYIPDFPAWTYEQVAVGYATGDRISSSPLAVIAAGHVVSANRLARRAGIVPGITASRAKSLSPELSTYLRDGDLEEAVWEETLLKVNQVTPFIENSPPPFVYFRPGNPDETRLLVRTLRAKAGIASHRTFARLASIRAATGNLLVLSDRVVQSFLRRFPVDPLEELDFEEDLIERLKLFGYDTLGAISNLSSHHLEAQFGNEGTRLFSILHPDDEPLMDMFELPPTIPCRLDLDNPLTEPGELHPLLHHLINLAIKKLQNQLTQRVMVFTQYHGSSRVVSSSRILGRATDKPHSLFRAAELLLDRLIGPEKEVESLGIQLGALRYAQPLQTTLFRERPSPYSAVKAVHRHYPGLIQKAVLQPGALFSDEAVKLEAFGEPAKQIPQKRR